MFEALTAVLEAALDDGRLTDVQLDYLYRLRDFVDMTVRSILQAIEAKAKVAAAAAAEEPTQVNTTDPLAVLASMLEHMLGLNHKDWPTQERLYHAVTTVCERVDLAQRQINELIETVKQLREDVAYHRHQANGMYTDVPVTATGKPMEVTA
jgi:hypothetical protein